MGAWADHYAHVQDCNSHLDPAYYLHVLHDVVEQLAGPGGTVVEVGIGTACSTVELTRRGLYVIGVDNDTEVLKRATQRNKQALFVYGNALDMTKLFTERVQVAYSQGLLEHYSDREIRRILWNKLKIADYAVFSVPSQYWPIQDFGNERLMSLEAWAEILAPLKATVMRLEYCDTLVNGRYKENVLGVLTYGRG